MSSPESRNEMLVTVLIDLAAICNKLAENPVVPENLRVRAREFVLEFNSLVPVRGKGTAAQHFQGEQLIAKIARFLPRILEVQAYPAIARK